MTPFSSRPSGFALVAVVWMVAVLSMLAVGLAISSRDEVRRAQGARAFAEAAALGDAAIQLAAREIRFAAQPIDRLTVLSYEVDGREVKVQIAPANGFIDINTASQPLLHQLFAIGGSLGEEEAEQLAQRVIDWRDADDQALPLGAENPDYEEAGVAFRTRGGPFDSPEDLLQVLGLGFDVYDKIRGFVTTFSDTGGVSPLAASPGVLNILGGSNAERVSAFAAARDAGDPAIDMSAFNPEYLSGAAAGGVYRMAAVSVVDGRSLVRVRWLNLVTLGAAGLPWRSLRTEPVRALDDLGGGDA